MKKLILASVSGVALLGLAACTDTDTTTTQGLPAEDPAMTTTTPGATGTMAPPADVQTESLAPEADDDVRPVQ